MRNDPTPEPIGPHRSRPALPAAIWALGLVSLLMDASSELVQSLLPMFLSTVLGASGLAIGLVDGLGEATALVIKVFSGLWSDRTGRRKPLAVFGYGLAAASKPLFALAGGVGTVLAARLIDRTGKGLRGAPRDALVADLTAPSIRGAAYGLRQALDTVGAFLGPLLAMVLMLAWHDHFRAVFAVAVVPALLSVAVLAFGVREPARPATLERPARPLSREQLERLPPRYWWVVVVGGVFTLARFSEAFLILRARQAGLSIALTPLVLVAMNIVYSAAAYPFGRLADRYPHRRLLYIGLLVLLAADLALAAGTAPAWVTVGVMLWGLHMAITQGLLATMVAEAAPAHLRGTAFGLFNLVSGAAVLLASLIAGELWDRVGGGATFVAGAVFCVLTMGALLRRH